MRPTTEHQNTRKGKDMTTNTTRRAATVAGAALALLLPAASASASLEDRGRFSGHFGPFSFTDCDMDLIGEGDFHEEYVLTAPPSGDGQVFLLNDEFWMNATITNPSTGKWVALTNRDTHHELQPTQVEGNIYRYIEQGEGMETMYDMDGNVVMKGAGQYRMEIVVDTLGDGQPGGVEVTSTDIRLVGYHADVESDYCETFRGALT